MTGEGLYNESGGFQNSENDWKDVRMRTIHDRETLVNLFAKWGARNPEYWAEQELSNDRDAIVTMFRFLHLLQENLTNYEERPIRWIDGEITHQTEMGPTLKAMLEKGVSRETINRFAYWMELMAYDVALTRLANPSAIDDGLVGWPEWELIEVIYIDHDTWQEEKITGRILSRLPELFPFHDPDREGVQALKHRQWLRNLLSSHRPVLDNLRSKKQLMVLFAEWEADEAEWLAEEELNREGYPYLAIYRLFHPMQLLLDLFLKRTEEWMASEMDEARSPLGSALKEMLGKGAKPEGIGKLTWLLFYWGCSNVLNRHDHLYSDRHDELPDCLLREIRPDGKRKPGNARYLGQLDELFPLRRPDWYKW